MKTQHKDIINWGIIGVGKVCEVKSGPAFYKVAHSALHAVMRRNAEKAADFAQRHKVARWYSSAMELINDPKVDAIYIATPPNTHASYAIAAMKAKKPVYVEKPMAKSFAECQEMLQVSEETGMPLWVAYYRRSLPAFLKAKELIDSGTIGKPLIVNIKLYKVANERKLKPNEMSWHVFPEISGAGHFFDLASHQLDFLDFILGEITEVKGTASNRAGLYPAEDTVSASWKHKSGVIGNGTWCFVVDENSCEDYIQIIGEKGELSLPCFKHGTLQLKTESGTEEFQFKNPEHISQNLVQQVVNELRGIGNCVSTGESAARTSWVMDEMVKDYYAELKDKTSKPEEK